MGTILTGILAAVILAVAAAYVVPSLQEPAYEAFATSSVRVGAPGSNLVGRDWISTPEPRLDRPEPSRTDLRPQARTE